MFRGSPSGNRYLSRVLESLDIKSDESILDIGCSKGSAIKWMQKFSFSRVDGIEISGVLAGIAETNFNKLGYENSQVFNMDAREFGKYGEYKYFYMYNPFPEVIMKKVIKSIKSQIGHQKAVLIYNNPVCHGILTDHEFVKVNEFPDQWGNGIYVYEINS